jgi:L-glyceraldehyde 3-phosphate reductase
MEYQPSPARYQSMKYNRVGRSGVRLPAVSLGLWHNFGDVDVFQNGRTIARRAFDLGITHFDLANNYGPSPGSAEETFGALMRKDFHPYRDEMIISSKAGYLMWPGPYGEWGSRKYLVASCDQSLARMSLKYVDIFYSHRFDPETPLEETMGALDYIVRSGRALYAGISSYNPEQTAKAAALLKALGTPCLIHQPSYSMFNRWIEDGLLAELDKQHMGCIVFSPLAQGLLSSKYLNGIPEGSRAAKHTSLDPDAITPAKVEKVKKLNEIAKARRQSLAQMAVAWTLRHKQVTSSLIGASKVAHVEEAVGALDNLEFTAAELASIESILGSGTVSSETVPDPISSRAVDRGPQRIDSHGLGEEIVHSRREASLTIAIHGVRGQRDYRYVDATPAGRARTQLPRRFEPIHLGHVAIHEHEVERFPHQRLECGGARTDYPDAVAQLPKHRFDDGLIHGVVLGHQDRQAFQPPNLHCDIRHGGFRHR